MYYVETFAPDFHEYTGGFATYERARNYMRVEQRRSRKCGFDWLFCIVKF
jgi:hypothetical protein